MPAQNAFSYTIIRVLPKVERQEFVNVAVVLFCRTLDYLDMLADFELARVKTLSPDADIDMIREQLKSFEAIVNGRPEAGYFANLSKSERFSWLAAPSSAIIQASPIHSGISDTPKESLQCLYDLLVA